MKCAECIYFDLIGLCYRFPPIPVVRIEKKQEPDSDYWTIESEMTSEFPVTHADDWCGEFHSKATVSLEVFTCS